MAHAAITAAPQGSQGPFIKQGLEITVDFELFKEQQELKARAAAFVEQVCAFQSIVITDSRPS
ncbi:hypothetical protein CV770_39740 [Bradyrhizobium sp. AC87j1]|nr:hypothetical protein CV770_39740 [Bradyrhizobium sp. AC87j1]